jgi:hypothetical protein
VLVAYFKAKTKSVFSPIQSTIKMVMNRKSGLIKFKAGFDIDSGVFGHVTKYKVINIKLIN